MTDPLVLEHRVDDTRTDLVLNAPERRNALSSALVEALVAGLGRAVSDGVDVVVLRGLGPAFCAGLDLRDVDRQTDEGLLHRFVGIAELLDHVAEAPFLTVAAVHGHAVGAGADLAMACDARVALAGTTFSFPGAQFGLVLGTARLAQVVGAAIAMRLALTGTTLTAQQLAHCGALTFASSQAEQVASVNELASCAGRMPGGTVRALRRAADPRAGVGAVEAVVRSVAEGPSIAQRVRAFAEARRSAGRPSSGQTTDSRSDVTCRN